MAPKRGWLTKEWGSLWCCHVIGPDDVIAATDFEDAVRRAREVNAHFGRTPEDENDLTIRGEVILWPWSAASHAENLEKERTAAVQKGTAEEGAA